MMQSEEVVTGLLTPLGEHDLRDLGIAQIIEVVELPPGGDVGDGLYIEGQQVHAAPSARISMATATTSPASSVRVT